MKNFFGIYKKASEEAKASIWFIVCSIIQKGIAFFTIPIFTRLLTTEQFGLSNVYQSWMSLVVIFATLNLQYGVFNTAMIKYENDRERYISSMQGLSTVITLVLMVGYWLGRELWNPFIGMPTLLMMFMFVEMLCSPALGFWSGKQRFEIKYKGLVFLTIAIAVLSPAVGMVLVLNTPDRGIARIIGCAIINVLVGAVLYIFNWKKGKTLFVKEYWLYALKFNVPLIPYYLSQMIFNQSDRLMIDHLSGRDKAGLYGVAYSLGLLLTFVINSINNSFVPWTYKCIKNKNTKAIKNVANGLATLIGVALLLLILATPELMRIIAAPEYYEARWVVPPIASSLFFLFLAQLSINVEFYYGRNTLLVKGSILSAVLNVVLNYFCIQIWGYMAAGYTTLASYIVFCISNYYCMKKVLRENEEESIYDIRFLSVLSILFLVISFILTWLYQFFVIRYVLILVILIIMVAKRKIILQKINQFREK